MGHLVTRNTRPVAGSSGLSMRALVSARICSVLVGFVLLALSLATIVAAQSGRNKEKAPKTSPTKPRSTVPVAEPTKSPPPARSNTPSSASQSRPNSEEVDPSDTVRVTSNLVPIPASVVDPKGFAIIGLKLEDFELLVDGQVKSISDMTRAETSVRLAMLFDNSGSLDMAREFEKQAAMHFFRKAMRPSDEA